MAWTRSTTVKYIVLALLALLLMSMMLDEYQTSQGDLVLHIPLRYNSEHWKVQHIKQGKNSKPTDDRFEKEVKNAEHSQSSVDIQQALYVEHNKPDTTTKQQIESKQTEQESDNQKVTEYKQEQEPDNQKITESKPKQDFEDNGHEQKSKEPKKEERKEGKESNDAPVSSKEHQTVHDTQRKWQQLKDNHIELYVYSAFYDTRETGDGQVVRVIGVSQRLDKKDNKTVYCMVSYGKDSQCPHSVAKEAETSRIPVLPNKIGVGISHNKTWFREYILICNVTALQSNSKDCVPSHVKLVTNQTLPHQDTMSVKVEVAKKYEKPDDFGVCVASSFIHRDVVQTVNWMEMQKLLGAKKVLVYNHSLDQESSELFRHYEREGFVEINQSPPFWEKQDRQWNVHKSPTINDCYYRNMYRFLKIVVIDYDEMIIPVDTYTYAQLLAYVELTPKARKDPHPHRCYSFRNVYYFFELPEDQAQRPEVIPLRHRIHVKPSGPGYSVKSILDPYVCTDLHNHYCWRRAPIMGKQKGVWLDVDPSVARLQHYKKCHFKKPKCEEMMSKNNITVDAHIMKYKSELVPNVLGALSKINSTYIVGT